MISCSLSGDSRQSTKFTALHLETVLVDVSSSRCCAFILESWPLCYKATNELVANILHSLRIRCVPFFMCGNV